jgi:hypothetical protein
MEIGFGVAISSLTLLRFMTDHITALSYHSLLLRLLGMPTRPCSSLTCSIPLILILLHHTIASMYGTFLGSLVWIETHDIMLSLVPLLEMQPWTRRIKRNGVIGVEKFTDGKWLTVGDADILKVNRVEGQVLSVF